MKILITGANGMVAKAAIKHCREIGDDVVSFTRQQLDISNRNDVSGVIELEKPDGIINCAAYTDVDGCENKREECNKVNAIGVENLALSAKRIGCSFLTISTDYVFDGRKSGFYTQRDAPNPIGFYGKTKLEGEVLAKKAYDRSIIVRAGWIFGRSGKNFLSSIHKPLLEGKFVRAISDSFGVPTFAEDLSKRMRQLIEIDLPEIYHVSNSGQSVSYYDFALKICELKDLDPNLVGRISAGQLQRLAGRPANSSLECLVSKERGLSPLPGWEESLETFLAQQKT